ncbi:MAG: 30S ribosomal protein S9 [Candidatus Marsarchaeota archaeon]|jgi:small subunit ribosomal protein S9|nr:30S ribosomal protein S9 [Candidatus Marsarchaeota archaeon]
MAETETAKQEKKLEETKSEVEKAEKTEKVEKPKKAARTRKKPSKKAGTVIVVKSKRKRSIARGVGKPGSGIIRINGANVMTLKPEELKQTILRPVYFNEITKGIAEGLDISINVKGGGISGQAQASGSAIAKLISSFAGSDTVRKEYMHYDRNLLIDDARRVEPKKFLGPKARARNQTSYR